MRRFVSPVLAGILLVVTGCATPVAGPGAAATSAVPRAGAAGDQALIFIAVLRRYLTTPAENSFGDGFENVFVLDHTDGGAGDPLESSAGPGTPITADDQSSIASALRDLGSVTFVSSPDEVLINVDSCALVRDGGILMTLGDPVTRGDHLEVGVSGFVACLGATWLTYVLVRDGSDWRVTGTTGSIAVA